MENEKDLITMKNERDLAFKASKGAEALEGYKAYIEGLYNEQGALKR